MTTVSNVHPHIYVQLVSLVLMLKRKYFTQSLSNYKPNFASKVDYMFFAHSFLEEHNLNSSINIAMQKVNTSSLISRVHFDRATCSFRQDYRKLIRVLYWKQFLYEVLVMVKQPYATTFWWDC